MKKIKKASALLMILFTLIFAVACTNDPQDTSDDVLDPSSPSANSEPSVSVVPPSLNIVSELSPDIIPWD